MDVSRDELAGVIDLFGALTRAELGRALEELAYKRGEDVTGEAFDGDVEAALDSYHLVAVEPDATPARPEDDARGRAGDADLLVAGPVAFPTLPEGAEDLPHIMDVEGRVVDRERAGEAARERLRADAAAALQSEDCDRVAELLDVSYDVETWAPVDLEAVRDHLDGSRAE
jgi:hypothetical protein